MKYDFDTVIERRGSDSVKWDSGEMLVKMGMTDRFDADTISAFTADMDFLCATPIIEAIQKRAEHGIYGYTSTSDATDYFDAITNWFKTRYAWDIKREEVVYMNGTVVAVAEAVEAFTQKGDGVIIMRPVYFPFTNVICSRERIVVNCQLINDGEGNYAMDFDAFEQLAAEEQTTAFILCNPHNPVGKVWSKKELIRISDICKRNNVLILADEIHGDLTRMGVTFYPIASLVEDDTHIVTFTAVNKTFNLAGLQMTNAVIPDEKKRKQYQKTIGHVSPSPFGMAALVAAYTKCDDWLLELRTYLDANVDWVIAFLKEHMPEVKCVRPEGTYIMWMDFRGYGLSAEEIRKRIYVDANVCLEGGTMFDPDAGAGFERICVPMSRSVLKEAFYRIEKAFVGK